VIRPIWDILKLSVLCQRRQGVAVRKASTNLVFFAPLPTCGIFCLWVWCRPWSDISTLSHTLRLDGLE
jgi:hypothetical protein